MLSLTAKDIMTRDVVTIKKGSSIEEALKLMACNGVSGLPVVDGEGNLVGIITESDLLLKGQALPADKQAKRNSIFTPHPDGIAEAYRRAQSDLVEEAMTKKVLAFMEESLVADIARRMIEHAVNRVPILRDNKVMGIVSRRDVIMALAQATTGENICGDDEARSGKLIDFDI